jgi:hypothetical protein
MNLQPTARLVSRYPKRTQLTTTPDGPQSSTIAAFGHPRTIEGLLLQEQIDGLNILVVALFGALIDTGKTTPDVLCHAIEQERHALPEGDRNGMRDRALQAALATFRSAIPAA